MRERRRKDFFFLRETEYEVTLQAGKEQAAEDCNWRISRFNREEQQRYQWPATAGSASSREQQLMDVECDIHFTTVQPHISLCDIWYFSGHVQSGLIVSTWHTEAFKPKKCKDTCHSHQSCEMCVFLILQIRNVTIWHSAGWETMHKRGKVITHSLML